MRARTKFIILSLGAIAGLIAFLLIKSSAPADPPIGLGVQSYTNACASITLTNFGRFKLDYVLKVERKTADAWPEYPQGIPLGPVSGPMGTLSPGEISTLTVPVMVYAPSCPWRVSLFCYRNPVPPGTARFKAGVWLMRWHMPGLARRVLGGSKAVRVSGPQMEQ